jgi:hypothetical protein
MKSGLTLFVVGALLVGCAAVPVSEEARGIELVNDKPDMSKCKFLGEVTGSQGNWITGDLTPNKNLIEGARNKLRNEAHKLGGNIVYVQGVTSQGSWGSLGLDNSTIIGKTYKCST